MTFINKLIRSFWPFIGLCIVLFVAAVVVNSILDIPAQGIDRLYSFAPLAIVGVMKARTMKDM